MGRIKWDETTMVGTTQWAKGTISMQYDWMIIPTLCWSNDLDLRHYLKWFCSSRNTTVSKLCVQDNVFTFTIINVLGSFGQSMTKQSELVIYSFQNLLKMIRCLHYKEI